MIHGNGSFDHIRAQKDREYVAWCLLSYARTKALYVKGIPAADREEAASDVVLGLLREWEKGVLLADLLSWVNHRLRLGGIGYYRKESNRPELTLDCPIHDDSDTLRVDMIATNDSSVEETVLANERFAALAPRLKALEAHIAETTDERLKIIHSLALQGKPRKEIAEALTSAGLPTSPDNVHQIIKRKLRDPFPDLAFLWDQHN